MSDSTPTATVYTLQYHRPSGEAHAVRYAGNAITGVSAALGTADVDAIVDGPALLPELDYETDDAPWATGETWSEPYATFTDYAPGSDPRGDLCHHGNAALYCQRCDDEAIAASGIDPTPTVSHSPRTGPFVRWNAARWDVYADDAPDSPRIGRIYRTDPAGDFVTRFCGYHGDPSQCVAEVPTLPEAARAVYDTHTMTIG